MNALSRTRRAAGTPTAARHQLLDHQADLEHTGWHVVTGRRGTAAAGAGASGVHGGRQGGLRLGQVHDPRRPEPAGEEHLVVVDVLAQCRLSRDDDRHVSCRAATAAGPPWATTTSAEAKRRCSPSWPQ